MKLTNPFMKNRFRTAMLLVLFWAPGIQAGVCDQYDYELPELTKGSDVAHGQGVLFRVQRGNLPASYLFGTIHVADSNILKLSAPVQKAFDESTGFVMEVLMDADDIAEFAGQMFYKDGTRLSTLVNPELFKALVNKLSLHSVPEQVADLLKPWAAYVTLSFPPSSGALPLDLVLMAKAQKAGKSLHALESMAEQIKTLSDGTLEEQITMLSETVCNYNEVQAQLVMMKQLWLERDLATMLTMVQASGSDQETLEAFLEGFLWSRNQRMVKRMQTQLSQGEMFIAVGALHLPGDKGILALLEKRGYSVEAVY